MPPRAMRLVASCARSRATRSTAHALTHAHPDHQGASHAVCERLGLPFWVGARRRRRGRAPGPDRRATAEPPSPGSSVALSSDRGTRSTAGLLEGDEVAGFEVLDVPGHSAGHVAFWRESDRVLVLGDVLNNVNILTRIPGLHTQKPFLTPDPPRNVESAGVLAGLEPKLVLFGHGAPLRDTRRFVDFVAALPG